MKMNSKSEVIVFNLGAHLVTYVDPSWPHWLRSKLESCEVPPEVSPPKGLVPRIRFWLKFAPVRRCWCAPKDAGPGDRVLYSCGLQQRDTWGVDSGMYYGEWLPYSQEGAK